MNETLIKVLFGSHLYGTNTPESDTDYKSVHIPPGNQILMQNFPRVITNSTGSITEKNSKNDIDNDSISLLKYFDMLKAGDMVAIELLFVKPEQALYMSDKWKELILPYRHRLLDRNIKGFVGYIRQQANKYGIKGSRVATARAAVDLFRQLVLDYGNGLNLYAVPYDVFDEFVSTHDHCSLLQLPMGKNDHRKLDYIEILNRKIGFTVSIKEALNIMTKIFDEYGSRALAAEKQEGIDWKSLYHAIRVSEQAIELLETHNIAFPRPNVDDLLSIKHGEKSYHVVSDRLEGNLDYLEKLMEISKLPEKIDEEFINETIESLHLESVLKYYNIMRSDIHE